MKVAIGIPTYNRRHMVELNAASLCSSVLSPETKIIVIDDASTDYDVEFLRSIYPKLTDIRRRAENTGDASFAIHDTMRQLLKTDAEALLLLDSDLIVDSSFLETAIHLLRETEGILSLFNTPNHPTIGSRGALVLKKTIGSAGTLWRRDLAAAVTARVPTGPGWDWRFSDFLVKEGIEICVARNSLVQHVGFASGQNCKPASGDFGVGFSESDARNAYRLVELLMSDSQTKFRETQRQINMVLAHTNVLHAQIGELMNRTHMLDRRMRFFERWSGIRLRDRFVRFVRRQCK